MTDTTLTERFYGGADELVFWAFRYFLGRMTIATCQFAEDLSRAWPLLSEHVRDLIRKELDEAFRRDDQERAKDRARPYPLGMDCDREAWQKVRDAYDRG